MRERKEREEEERGGREWRLVAPANAASVTELSRGRERARARTCAAVCATKAASVTAPMAVGTPASASRLRCKYDMTGAIRQGR